MAWLDFLRQITVSRRPDPPVLTLKFYNVQPRIARKFARKKEGAATPCNLIPHAQLLLQNKIKQEQRKHGKDDIKPKRHAQPGTQLNDGLIAHDENRG